ncbi:glycosyltransferase family 2 protein [Patescibacteria group bacterium]
MNNPLVSIVIVNFNGKKWLKDCLTSVFKQTYKNYEVIFVDNNSSDESVDYVKKNYPKVKIINNHVNTGFAGGNNLGFSKSSGEYLLSINNDTKFGKHFLEKLLKSFENSNISIAQPKIISMDSGKIDSCGSYWTDSSFLYYIGNDKNPDLKKYNKPFPVFSIKGVALLVKREVVEKIGLFDVDFWSYYEETDLCQRAWLSGYESWYWPEATIYHAMGGTSLNFDNEFIQFHNFKNKLCSILKNFSAPELIKVLSVHVSISTMLSITWLFQGRFKHSFSLYRALAWNVLNIGKTYQKRVRVQSMRKMRDKDIFVKVKKNPRFEYYKFLFRASFADYTD